MRITCTMMLCMGWIGTSIFCFLVVLVVEDVSSRKRLMALLSTLLVGSWLQLLAVLSTLLINRVVTDVIVRMLIFFFPIHFFICGIFLLATQFKKIHCCFHRPNSPRLFQLKAHVKCCACVNFCQCSLMYWINAPLRLFNCFYINLV